MPAITLSIDAGGPIIDAMVHVSQPRFKAMQDAGLAIPPAVTGRFLIDTGASGTCVDPDLIAPLSLPIIGQIPISTPSTNGQQHFCDQFDCALFIPGASNGGSHFVPALPVIATHLRSQGIDGLIGRDVLKMCTITYIGTSNIISLSF